MIVIGYQGIGKSSLTNTYPGEGFIDLESGLFKDPLRENKRWPNWADIYCNIALSLNWQGYTVLVSSHKAVQEILEKACQEIYNLEVIAVYPSPDIQDEWVNKLRERWEKTGRSKDEIAYLDAKRHFAEEIKKLQNLGIMMGLEIQSMDYNLHDILMFERARFAVHNEEDKSNET